MATALPARHAPPLPSPENRPCGSSTPPHDSPCSGTWKKHWFVLSEHVLYYFDSPGEDKPKLILPMDSVRVGR